MRSLKRRRSLWSLLLLCALGLLLCAELESDGARYVREKKTRETPALVEELGFLEFRMSSPAGWQTIRPWCSPTGECFLFLPACAQESGLRAMCCAGFDGLLDGQPIREDRVIELTPGEHVVELPDEGREFRLNVMQSSGLPAVFLETASGSLEALHADKEYEEEGSAVVLHPDGSTDYHGPFELLKGRGNVTWAYTDKKGYQLRFEQEVPLLGMEPARRWLLVSNALDPALIRNWTTFQLARESGMQFVPDSSFADLYINGEYRGMYQIYEKIETVPGRVEIRDMNAANRKANPELPHLGDAERGRMKHLPEPMDRSKGYHLPSIPEDSTGGYLLELDLDWRYDNYETSGFVSSRGQYVVVKSPRQADLRQVDYIRQLYQHFEDAAFSPDCRDPQTGKPLEELIDLHSFALKYLLEELVKNQDSYSTSQYLYKPEDAQSTLLFAGPPWDYDRALGVRRIAWDYTEQKTYDLSDPTGFYTCEELTPMNFWHALYQQPVFRAELERTFENDMRPAADRVLEQVPGLTEALWPSIRMDLTRWEPWPTAITAPQREQCFRREVSGMMDFLRQRTDWLHEQWTQ